MIDGHIHIERGDYLIEWIEQFVNKAVEHNGAVKGSHGTQYTRL